VNRPDAGTTSAARRATASRDTVFDRPREAEDFAFGEEVVAVFDDMVNRSVPFYGEIQRMLAELARGWAKPGTNVYDLGCATGNTLIGLDPSLGPNIGFVGIDDSDQMLAMCGSKLRGAGVTREVVLERADLARGVTIRNASVVVLCLTLQFIRPIHRERLIRKACTYLLPYLYIDECLLNLYNDGPDEYIILVSVMTEPDGMESFENSLAALVNRAEGLIAHLEESARPGVENRLAVFRP